MEPKDDQLNFAPSPEDLYLKGRAVDGTHRFGPDKLARLRESLAARIREGADRGILIQIPFPADQERSVLLLAITLGMNLPVHFTQFLDSPSLELPPDGADVWVIHHAPRFNDFDLAVDAWLGPGRVVVATGLDHACDRMHPPVLPLLVRDFILVETDVLGQEEDITSPRPAGSPKVECAFRIAILFDAFGAPLPFDWLARACEDEPDRLAPLVEEAFVEGRLFWVEREKPPALLVTTRGESFAMQQVLEVCPGPEEYWQVLFSIDFSDREERYTALKLFQGWLADPGLRNRMSPDSFGIRALREAITRNRSWFTGLLRESTAVERLLWGRCLSRLGLHQEADRILKRALAAEPKNPFMAVAHAHALANWARTEPTVAPRATKAFDRAERIAHQNPYIHQIRGVFAAEAEEWYSAERHYERALSIDPGNLAVHVARADMHLDRGMFEDVREDLAIAQELEPANPYVLHLAGRLAFCLGDWREAEEQWRAMLKAHPQHALALHSLGHMARVRRRVDAAREWLGRVLARDPENVPTLLEFALLEIDQEVPRAIQSIRQALEIEPHNPKLLTALARAELRSGRPTVARTHMEALIAKWPENRYGLHILALCCREMSDIDRASRLLDSLMTLTRGASLAALATRAQWLAEDKRVEDALHLAEKSRTLLSTVSNRLPAHKRAGSLERIAEVYRRLKNSEVARALDDEALKILEGDG